MPTIAELLAAKQAKQAAPPASPKSAPVTTAPKESIAERIELDEAIDRIDPPGKRQRANEARSGLVLTKNMPCPPKGEARGQATPITGPELPVPADDMAMVVYQDATGLWLSMPCADPSHPPIKVLRLPWVLHNPAQQAQPLSDEIPF